MVQPPGTPIPQKKTTYDWTYQYAASGPNSTRPHAPIHIGQRSYTYDANGNQEGWTHDQNGTRRDINWDEENRIKTLFDNGHEKAYKYDDQGNRTIKRGPQGETVYVNQFFTQRPGATGTKHVYAGTTRIASKLLRQETPNSNPAGKTPYEKDLYFYHPDHLGSSSYVTDLNGKLYEHLQYFPFGEAWIEENTNAQRTPYHFTSKELDEETGLYYFGARYYDPRTSVWQSADPALEKYLPSVRRDNSNLPGMGGVYNSLNLGMYSYAHLNGVRYTDPNGEFAVPIVVVGAALLLGGGTIIVANNNPEAKAQLARGINKLGENFKSNVEWASGKIKNLIFNESSEVQSAGGQIDLDDPSNIDQSEKEVQGLKGLPAPADSTDPYGRERETSQTTEELLGSLTGNRGTTADGKPKVDMPGGRTAVGTESTSRGGRPSVVITNVNRPGGSPVEVKIRTRPVEGD